MVDRVVLVGMMGAGKSTVGHLLAERLGWRYLDSDEQVMAETGHSVPEIFAGQGEQAFRAEEARVLAEALSSRDSVVVSAAGGVVLSEDNRDLIRGRGVAVWLRADPKVLALRVGDGAGRPLLDDDPELALVDLDRVRRPLYRSLASITVDVDTKTPDEVAGIVIEKLARRGIQPGTPA